jgi:hypothetical protein
LYPPVTFVGLLPDTLVPELGDGIPDAFPAYNVIVLAEPQSPAAILTR